ncbi:MAG: methionine gamma-lyase family protein [Clostridia bacterium]|nr:methionine gamma-lyase family protein [Clostridia bacterium]
MPNDLIAGFLSRCETELSLLFEEIDGREEANFRKVMEAFEAEQIAVRHFTGTNGYGYDDIGRDALERIYARIFGKEKALVRPSIASGTHALAVMFFGLLRPGDLMLSVTGDPYDTLSSIIAPSADREEGSLADYGISYGSVSLLPDGKIDYETLRTALRDPKLRVAAMQRSRGYAWRASFSTEELNACADFIHSLRPDVIVALDNCYGEFVDPVTDVLTADIFAGSLIKNPGGGIAPTGGYLVGREDLIDRCAKRLTAPGVGSEIGSYTPGYRLFYQGIWMVPHAVAQALKCAALFSKVFASLGFEVNPDPFDDRHDIIQAVQLHSEARLVSFCKAVQSASPIDSFVSPEPWNMPGYTDKVIMAAGTFVGGSSLELSADAPIREPYTVYMQGGLTYVHGKYAAEKILASFLEEGLITEEQLKE